MAFKRGRATRNYQKYQADMKMNHTELWEIKNITNEMENSLNKWMNRLDTGEERISEWEDRTEENDKNEVWYMYLIRVPEEENRIMEKRKYVKRKWLRIFQN